MTWLRGARCTDPSPPRRELRRMPETEARPRVKNRHGGAPRGERPASWDARRLARRLACRVTCTPHGCSAEHPNVSRRSAHPSFRVSAATMQTPGAENAPRERDGLFEIVSCERRDARPHPEERARRKASANSEGPCACLEGLILRSAHPGKLPQTPKARARVSKDGDDPVHAPSCFRRIAAQRCWGGGVRVRAAMLLSMRGEDARRILAKRSQWGSCLLDSCETDLRLQETIAGSGPLFRIVIYNEWSNSNV